MRISANDKEQIQAILDEVEKDVQQECRFDINRIDRAINDAEKSIKDLARRIKKSIKVELKLQLDPKGVTMPEMLGGAQGARVTLKRFNDGWYVVDISLTRCIPKPGKEQNRLLWKEI